MSEGTEERRERKATMYARTVQNTLRRYGPLDVTDLLDRARLDTERQVRVGMHFSRRHLDSAEGDLTNEIICCANMGGSHVYFLAASDEEAEDYETHRRAIALGHIKSVILLEEKRYEKWPNPQRTAAIKMLAMAHELLSTAP